MWSKMCNERAGGLLSISHSRTRRRAMLLAVAMAAAAAAVPAAVFAQSAKPISLSGWNVQDLYGTTTQPGATFVPFDDNNGYTWYAAGAPNPQGLPTANNRTFTSAANANTTFQFQPYDGTNNAVEL